MLFVLVTDMANVPIVSSNSESKIQSTAWVYQMNIEKEKSFVGSVTIFFKFSHPGRCFFFNEKVVYVDLG